MGFSVTRPGGLERMTWKGIVKSIGAYWYYQRNGSLSNRAFMGPDLSN